MIERALSFGSVAAAYERFRLGYPDEVVDAVHAYAESPIGTALEIGAGTGKATRAFARRGIEVTATDPDPAMLAELRRHVPSNVVTVQSSFEDLPSGVRYDLVFAAASLHWTDAAGRWPRVAARLRRGGVFASLDGPLHLSDASLEDAVCAARSPDLIKDDIPSPDGTPPGSAMEWPGTELLVAEDFSDVRQVTIPRRTTISSTDVVGYLSTVSAYLELPAPRREQVLARILEAIPDRVDICADIRLHLARRG